MLNITYRILIVLLITTLLASCGKPDTSQEILKKSVKEMKSLDSFMIDRTYLFESKINGELKYSFSVEEKTKLLMNEKVAHQSVKEVAKTSYEEENFTNDIYWKNGKVYSEDKDEGINEQNEIFDLNYLDVMTVIAEEGSVVSPFKIVKGAYEIKADYGSNGIATFLIDSTTFRVQKIELSEEVDINEEESSIVKDQYKFTDYNKVKEVEIPETIVNH